MRFSKSTKKNFARIVIAFIILTMLLPVVANMMHKPTAQDLLYEQVIENQLQSRAEEDSEVIDTDGSYLVTDVISSDTYIIKWGDEERTLKLIGVNSNDDHLDEIKEIVESRLLTLEFDIEHEDEEGNLLAYAYLEDGIFLNHELILQGYAAAKEEDANTRYIQDLKETEILAKSMKVGIWENYDEEN